MVIFAISCFKNVLKYLFYSGFEIQPKFATKKNNFSHFAKHRLVKKNLFCCNPLFDQKLVFLNLFVFETQNIAVEQNVT